jgi:Kelch motif
MNWHRNHTANSRGPTGGTGAIRWRVLLGVPLALGTAGALAACASAAAPAQAGAAGITRAALAAQVTRPGPAHTATVVGGSWTTLPAAPITKQPNQSLAVWTGNKMIVYGIRSTPSGWRSVNVAYDPATRSWQQLVRGPKPGARCCDENGANVAVWTGSEMLVLGPTAGAYNPATNTWRLLSPNGPGPTDGAVTGWTGQQVLVWGGVCCEASNRGMAYDVAADTWSPMGPSILAPRAFPAGGWDGHELIVAGGYQRGQGALRGAAAYDPPSGLWRRLRPMPRPRYDAMAVWDGRELLVLGGYRAPGTAPASRGMAYNPATNRWRLLAPMGYGRVHFTAVWTGRRVLVWGGTTGRDGTAVPPHGEAYNPATNAWSALPQAPLHGRSGPLSVWTGHQMVVWGGDGYLDGAAFTPSKP